MKLKSLFKLIKRKKKMNFTIDDDGVTCTSNARKEEVAGHWTETATQ